MRYSPRNIADQLAYVKNLGLNTLRFEGNLPPDDMFAQMDRAGILAMTGWQCCDRWENPLAKWPPELQRNAANQATRVAQWLRNHPSVFTFFQGSDEAPDAAKEAIYLTAFSAADWQTPQVASAEYKSSPRLGPSGAKEGPYNYVPPGYWWATGPRDGGHGPELHQRRQRLGVRHRDQRRQHRADAGLAQPVPDPGRPGPDLGPGHDEGPGHRAGHLPRLPVVQRYTKTARMGQYNTPLWNRYGPGPTWRRTRRSPRWAGTRSTRAQFEAYLGHSKDPANPSTGVIYWMLNKAWPSLHWNLYNYDFDQPGVYFGAQKAGEPVHIMYDYARRLGQGRQPDPHATGPA